MREHRGVLSPRILSSLSTLALLVLYSPPANADCRVVATKMCFTGDRKITSSPKIQLTTAQTVDWNSKFDNGDGDDCTSTVFCLTSRATADECVPPWRWTTDHGSLSLAAGSYYVSVNNKAMGHGTYTVTLDQGGAIGVTSGSPVDFGSQDLASTVPPMTVSFTWPFACGLSSVAVSSSDARFTVSGVPSSLAGDGSGSFAVRFTPRLLTATEVAGSPVTAVLTVSGKTDDVPVVPALVPVSGTIKPVASSSLLPSSATIPFGDVFTDTTKSKSGAFSVTSTGTETIDVTATVADAIHLAVTPAARSISRGSSQSFAVTFNAADGPIGSYDGTIVIGRRSRLGALPDETVHVTANIIRPAPRIVCGTPPVLETTDNHLLCFTYVFSNDGTKALDLTDAKFEVFTDNAPFPVFGLKDPDLIKSKGQPPPCDPTCSTATCQNEDPVPIGGMRPIEMMFISPPGARGLFRGHVRIHSDDPATPVLDCALEAFADPAVPDAHARRWQLSAVTFSDGATATGYFYYDSDTGKVPSWLISVNGGTAFPPFVYSPASSAVLEAPPPKVGGTFAFISRTLPVRTLYMTPNAPLPESANAVLQFTSALPENVECLAPCNPISRRFRFIDTGFVSPVLDVPPTSGRLPP